MQDDETSADDTGINYTGDMVLNFFVHMAEKGVSFPMTLYTSGLVFTGFVVSRKVHFEASKALAGPLEALYDELLSAMDDGASDRDDEGPAQDYAWVHMVEAQVISPGAKGMPTEGVPVRLKRSEIVGWSHGKLMAN